jgi:hypothetical protein
MFQDLDSSLAALVQAEIAVQGVSISFAAPQDQFLPTGVRLPALSFFLYDIREDLSRRTTEWDEERRPDGVTLRKRAPARVTCSYLITAWTSDSTPDPAQDEHRLLGELMKVLLRHRKIPVDYLRGELIGQEPPMPTRIMADNQLQSLGEFWQAMGGRPKAALHYGVTLSVDVFDARQAGSKVDTKILTLSPLTT